MSEGERRSEIINYFENLKNGNIPKDEMENRLSGFIEQMLSDAISDAIDDLNITDNEKPTIDDTNDSLN